jgi:drug/metabolite transporter (DMT)-like permease
VRSIRSERLNDGTSGASAGSDHAAPVASAVAAAAGERTPGIVPQARGDRVIGGIAVALAAACCYEGAYVLQALEARRAGGGARLHASLLGRLLKRPRWVGGTALSGAGALLQIYALTLAPLTVVQPVLALGLVLLLVLSALVLHEHVGRRELAGVAAIVCGVAVVTLVAAPGLGGAGDALGVALLAFVLGTATLLPFAFRARVQDARARVLAAAAGDAWAAIGLKLVADALDSGSWLPALAWAASAALAGFLALTAEMSALQRIAATRVAPVVVSAQVLVPVIAGPLVFDEPWADTVPERVALGLAIVAVAGGAALLGGSSAVADVIAVGELKDDVGSDGQPGERGDG